MFYILIIAYYKRPTYPDKFTILESAILWRPYTKQPYFISIQWCGSGLIVSGSRSTKFECETKLISKHLLNQKKPLIYKSESKPKSGKIAS